jgi:hypothetical protein
MAPGTTATTIDTHSGGILSAACPAAGTVLNEITLGDSLAQIADSVADVDAAGGAAGGQIVVAEADDPEGTIALVPVTGGAGGVGGGATATDGLLVVSLIGGTVDGGLGVNTTYNLLVEGAPGAGGGPGVGTPDAPPSGCLIAGTRSAA